MDVVRHTEICTRDPEEARAAVAALFCDHELVPLAEDRGVALTLRADELGPLSIVHLDYGAPVSIKPEPLSDFYLVQIPRGGAAKVIQDGTKVTSTTQTASVLSPTGQVSMTWGAENPQLCLYLSRRLVEAEAAVLIGRPPGKPVVFELGMALAEPDAATFLRSVLFLNDELRRSSMLVHRPELIDSMAATLAGQLLLTQPSIFSRQLRRVPSTSVSTVQRVVDYIEANVGDPQLSVSRIARELGVSSRSMQDAFRRELGTTPVSYVKERRLSIAHRRLEAGDPRVTTVTRIATALGITHLGRFAVEYRAHFGESPSDTLARPRHR